MTDDARVTLVRRGLWLNYATLSYNIVEAAVSLLAGLLAGSVALVGFGFDSVIEVIASVAAQCPDRTLIGIAVLAASAIVMRCWRAPNAAWRVRSRAAR